MKRRKTLPGKSGYYLFDNGSSPPRYERTMWTIADVRWDRVHGELYFQKIGSTDYIPVRDTNPHEWGSRILIRKISNKQIEFVPTKGETKADRIEAERKLLESAGDNEKLIEYLEKLQSIAEPKLNGDKASAILRAFKRALLDFISEANDL